MNTEPITNRCPKCQAPLPANAPQGLCPKCLLAAASTPTDAGQPAHRTLPPPIETVAAAFPQLEILELIGHGGMGVVYKARQPRLDRLVALKLLPQSLAADAAFAERFNREARVLARLNHPNIVTVHDFGQSGGFFYLLMEFVDGVNLRQAMQAGRFTPQQAMMLVPKICEALQFAHDEGILHRDIKPENILLDTRGRVKIADFGIAKLVGETREKLTLTASGSAIGTPHYMAPEQLEHPQDVDQRADIYSLGVVFYEMLTGELPIGRFAPPSQKSSVDARVDEVVFHALEKEREKRFRSAGEVKTSVEAITSNPAGRPAQAAPAQPSLGVAIPERRIPCYISTPEHLSTFTGHFVYIYTGKGELRLDAENLTFVSNWQSTVIPLHDIRELGIGHYSRLAKPLRLEYLAVTFEQAGQRRTLLFTPCIRGGISLPWEVNPRVAECLRAVREAVIARTGQAPGGPSPAGFLGGYLNYPLRQAIKVGLAIAVVAAALPIALHALRTSHFQASSERVPAGPSASGTPSAPSSEGQLVLDTVPMYGTSTPGVLKYHFKCLLPAHHLTRVLFIRWTNGVPEVYNDLSGYFKVGNAPIDADFDLTSWKLAETDSTQPTNVVDWAVSLFTRLFTPGTLGADFPGEPPYLPMHTPSKMIVHSGHQGIIRLVDYVGPEGQPIHGESGIELRIFLEPMKHAPVPDRPIRG